MNNDKGYLELAQEFKLDFDLRPAFIHRSYLNESQEKESNERLEFLGDAVLELCATEFLYHKFPNKAEGEMTAIRSALVRKENLAAIARNLRLGDYLLLSRGEEASGGRDKDYILANTLEALIGVVYTGTGMKTACEFINSYILPTVDKILEEGRHVDAKSYFQEMAQAKKSITPTYKLLRDEGPDHAKSFVMGAYLDDELVGEGEGSSKQLAEEDAARNSIDNLGWEE